MSKRIVWTSLLCLLLIGWAGAQQVPPEVRYKKASAADNKKATACAKKLLNVKVPDKVILASLDKAVTCGPKLWTAMKGVAPQTLQKALKATFVVPYEDGVQHFEGRVARKDEERKQLWIHVLAVHNKFKKFTIRKAKAVELKYYWSIIPYDIEEPLLIADYGKIRLMLHFNMVKGQPRVYFIDLVPAK